MPEASGAQRRFKPSRRAAGTQRGSGNGPTRRSGDAKGETGRPEILPANRANARSRGRIQKLICFGFDSRYSRAKTMWAGRPRSLRVLHRLRKSTNIETLASFFSYEFFGEIGPPRASPSKRKPHGGGPGFPWDSLILGTIHVTLPSASWRRNYGYP